MCSVKDLSCGIPNCPNKASEWHHIKHRKRIVGKNFQKKITAYTAKQIAVCAAHHQLIHSGKYDGPSLRCDFTGTCCEILVCSFIDKALAIRKSCNDVRKETGYLGLLI